MLPNWNKPVESWNILEKKNKLFGLMFLQKQKLRLKLPRQLHLVQYWTVFFTGLKMNRYSEYFPELLWQKRAAVFCVHWVQYKGIIYSWTYGRFVCCLFLDPWKFCTSRVGSGWTHHTTPLSTKHSIFYTWWHFQYVKFFTCQISSR